MCLNCIIAHETYHYYLALPLKPAPTISPNNMRHLELKNSSAYLFFWSTSSNFEILGLVIYGWKGLEITFPTVYYTPQSFKSYRCKMKQNNL
jgi:hypothetical protein